MSVRIKSRISILQRMLIDYKVIGIAIRFSWICSYSYIAQLVRRFLWISGFSLFMLFVTSDEPAHRNYRPLAHIRNLLLSLYRPWFRCTLSENKYVYLSACFDIFCLYITNGFRFVGREHGQSCDLKGIIQT